MPNLNTFSRHPNDEPVLQQLETYLQHLNFDNKAALAIAAFYEATEPEAISFDYNCLRSSSFNKSVALLGELSYDGKLAVTRAIAEELAVLKQLQEAMPKAVKGATIA